MRKGTLHFPPSTKGGGYLAYIEFPYKGQQVKICVWEEKVRGDVLDTDALVLNCIRSSPPGRTRRIGIPPEITKQIDRRFPKKTKK